MELNLTMRRIIILFLIVVTVASIFFLFFKPESVKSPKYVIIMLFDAARADRFSTYGYPKNTTPYINELAKEGVVFENAYSQASWTLPSVISIFTGMYSDFHGSTSPNSHLRNELMTLAECMHGNGYLTGGAYKNRWLVPSKNLNKGFDIWEYTRDRLITDFGIMMLDDRTSFFNNKNDDNLLKNFPPDFSKEKNQFLLNNPQEVIQDIAEINPDVLLKQRRIEVISSKGNISPGNYNWGMILRGKYRENSLELYLEGIDENGKLDRIETKIETFTNHWISLNYRVHLEKKYVKIALYFRYIQKNPPLDINLSIKRPFFVKQTNSDDKNVRGRFIYLHYLSPHEPHVSPGIEYNDFFNENPPEISISNSLGDPNDLNFLQDRLPEAKKKLRGWVNLDDNINFHHSNYLRQLRFIDDEVKKLVEHLKATGKYDDTLLILTSDHGEEFLDHGYVSHKMNLYNECLHIPLIIIYPKGLPKGIRIKENVASIDIFPTITSICNLEASSYRDSLKNQLMGNDLLQLINEKNKENFSNRIIYSSDSDLRQVAAVSKNIKLIRINSKCYDKSALFNLNSDPSELNDCSQSNKELTYQLSSAITRYIKSAEKLNSKTHSEKSSLKEEDKKQLQRLGYINFDDASSAIDPYCRLKKRSK